MSESLDVRQDQATDGRRDARGGWGAQVVVPARGAAGKTRLEAPAGVDHARLARALALDTVAAAQRARRVRGIVLVTPDSALAAALPAGARAVEEPLGADVPSPGADARSAEPRLLAAVRAGLASCSVDAPAAVLLGDLPALRTWELDEALSHARDAIERPADHPDAGGPHAVAAFVPDAFGTGTVLLVGATPGDLDPAFGRGSAAAHERVAIRLSGPWPGLRTDVDTAYDLLAALSLGVGSHTSAALRNSAHGTT